jgi:SAM-dependent methyltransferase
MKNLWDKVWEDHKYVSDYMLRWYDFLSGLSKSYKSDKKRVLEIGCGSAGGIGIFGRDGHDSYGVDLSPVAIEKARQNHPEVNFLCEDLFNMSFENGSFDLIFNSGLIEHFKYPKNVKAMRIMVKLLKPGGKLVIAVPNSLCLWYVLGKKLLGVLGKWPYGYEESYSPFLFKKYIKEAGEMELKKMFGIQPFPMTAFPGFEIVPLKIRAKISNFEKIMPLKEFYSYAIVAECLKK